MKFTSEDLMKAMGLVVGDRVKFDDDIWTVIYDENEIHTFYLHTTDGEYYHNVWLFELIDKDFKILPRPKKAGFVECTKENCKKCPIQYACNVFSKNPDIDWDCGCQATRYITLDLLNIQDQEIHDLLKNRLDKEVKEC